MSPYGAQRTLKTIFAIQSYRQLLDEAIAQNFPELEPHIAGHVCEEKPSD